MNLNLITPATAALDASPADVLAVAFPAHGRMVDPDAGVWIKQAWYPDAVHAALASPPGVIVFEDEHFDLTAALAASDVFGLVGQHLDMGDVPDVHPEDLPPCLPTRREQLDDVMHRPAAEITAAIWATGSAEPGVLLGAMTGAGS